MNLILFVIEMLISIIKFIELLFLEEIYIYLNKSFRNINPRIFSNFSKDDKKIKLRTICLIKFIL